MLSLRNGDKPVGDSLRRCRRSWNRARTSERRNQASGFYYQLPPGALTWWDKDGSPIGDAKTAAEAKALAQKHAENNPPDAE